jgi:hypothetical protein
MTLPRLIFSLLLAFALVFTQQEGMAHILSHTLDQQQAKHAPDSPACEKCQHYAQLGNALHGAAISFAAPRTPGETIHSAIAACPAAPAAGAPARAPPRSASLTA